MLIYFTALAERVACHVDSGCRRGVRVTVHVALALRVLVIVQRFGILLSHHLAVFSNFQFICSGC